MRYLIDTDWVAEILAGKPEATELLAALVDDGLAISLISYGELQEAVIWNRRWEMMEIAFLKFLRWARVLSPDETIMRRFAGLRGHLRASEQLIGDSDLLIAATALHHDLIPVTRRLEVFRRVPELKLYQPS